MAADLHIDIETYSEADLLTVGTYRYASDPSTKITLFSYAIDGEEVVLVDLAAGEQIPPFILEWLVNPPPDLLIWAHNAQFERTVIGYCLYGEPLAPEPWRCTSVWCRYLSLPGGLEAAGAAIGIEHQKRANGRKLIQRFCTPAGGGPNPGDPLWAEFRDYNIQDVRAEREIHGRLQRFPLPSHEWAVYVQDQRINDRGAPIDVPFVRAALDVSNANVAEATSTVEALGIANPRSVQQWMAFLEDEGVKLDNMRKKTLAKLGRGSMSEAAAEALALRNEIAAASVKKLEAMLRSVCADGRVRGMLQYLGADRTGRWSGRIIQPQNLPSGIIETDDEREVVRGIVQQRDLESIRLLYPETAPVLASLVRSCIAAPDGQEIVSADWSSVESVMLGWASGCEPLLRVFRGGLDAYKDFATHLYAVPYPEVTKQQRKISKPAVLGCGYGMGPGTLIEYAAGMGVELSAAEAESHVATFRNAYREIQQFWYAVGDAAIKAVDNKGTQVVKTKYTQFVFERTKSYLFIVLPTGRRLAYRNPTLRVGDFGPEIHYLSAQGKNMWIKTYGAKLVENIVQAISRDLLAGALLRAEKAGIYVFMHVHDEIVALVDESDTQTAKRLVELMRYVPRWATGAPLNCSSWQGKYYKKD